MTPTQRAVTRRALLRRAATGVSVLALAAIALPSRLAAHPLPGTVILISVEPARLSLTVTVPYTDLALAMAGQLPKTAEAGPIPATVETALGAYFAQHMEVAAEGQPDLKLTLDRAYPERATHEDVGAYTQLILDFSAPLAADRPVSPLTLTYDAVIHEIRNQSATVFLQSTGQKAVAIGEIRLDPATGKAPAFVVPTAP
jgi:hypothetical protein